MHSDLDWHYKWCARRPVSTQDDTRGKFKKTFTSVIYKCSYLLFSDSTTMAAPVNYTCKSFIKSTPGGGLSEPFQIAPCK